MEEKRDLLDKADGQVPAQAVSGRRNVPESLGERLIPLLIIAMLCCLLYMMFLVMAGLFMQAWEPLLPFWAALLLLVCPYGLLAGLKSLVQQRGSLSALPDLLVGIVLLAVLPVSLLFYIWLHFYAQQFALFDAGWLVTLIHDMSQPEVDFQLLLVGILLSVSGWLSGHMSEQQVNAALLLRKGSLLMSVLAALDLGEGLLQGRPDFWQAAMLFTTFFWLGLLAQSLQKASAKRRNHPMERSELAIRQERIIFQMMACLGLVVAGTDVAMIVIHGGLSIPFPRLNLFNSPPLEPTPLPSFSSQAQHLPVPRVIPLPSLSLSGSLWESVTALFVLLCIASLYFALRFWQKYRQRTKGKLVEQVERTSLWSLALFLAQCKSLLLALLAFLHLLLSLSSEPG